MISEHLEFQISQYADGTLPAAEVAALEAVLASDAEARALLDEYRAIDVTLKRELSAVPDVKWERFAEHLSHQVEAADRDEAVAAPVTYKISAWWTRAAVAAVVVITAGAAILWHTRNTGPVTEIAINPSPATSVTAVAIVEVSGPAAQVASGAPVEEIVIDATPLAKRRNYGVSETIVYRPPRIVMFASGTPERQDTSLLPY